MRVNHERTVTGERVSSLRHRSGDDAIVSLYTHVRFARRLQRKDGGSLFKHERLISLHLDTHRPLLLTALTERTFIVQLLLAGYSNPSGGLCGSVVLVMSDVHSSALSAAEQAACGTWPRWYEAAGLTSSTVAFSIHRFEPATFNLLWEHITGCQQGEACAATVF